MVDKTLETSLSREKTKMTQENSPKIPLGPASYEHHKMNENRSNEKILQGIELTPDRNNELGSFPPMTPY